MIRVLFVCLGNICRSPMAEGIFKNLIKEKAIENNFQVDSAGTSQYHIGALADPRMREKAAGYGINLTHLARQFTKNDFKEFDYIVAMDRSNYNNILAWKEKDIKTKIFLMRDLIRKKNRKMFQIHIMAAQRVSKKYTRFCCVPIKNS